jgi:hypothetical protein
MLDSHGVERFRLEGYLPREEFAAQLELGRARLAFVEQRWQAAEEIYIGVSDRWAHTLAAPEAVYWAGVCYYKRTRDHSRLRPMAERVRRDYPHSVAAKRVLPFLG